MSALPGLGGVGVMSGLSGLGGESDKVGVTGISGNRSNSRYSPVSGRGVWCPLWAICSGLLSKRTFRTTRT